MKSILKSSVKRVVSLFLSLLLVFQLFPASLITRVAATQDYSRVPFSLAESEVKDKEAIERLVSKPDLFRNWGGSGDDDVAGWTCIPAGWQQEILKKFLKAGVTYGVGTGSQGKTYYLPGVNAITGQDALAAALFYYYGSKNSDGFVSYSGAKGSSGQAKRQNTYDNAASYYNRAFNVRGDYAQKIRSIQGEDEITRYQVFLMIATAIEAKSGGRHSLSYYSDTKVGYLKNDKTKVRNYDISVANWWKNDRSDTADIEAQDGPFIQATNLMIDVCKMVGRGSGVGASDQRCAGGEVASYAEFYQLLANVSSDSHTDPPKMSEVVAKITARDVTQNVNYKDLENGEEVDVRVRPDTGESYSSLDATFKYSVEDETGRNSDDDTDTGTNYTAPSSTFTYRNGQELVVGRDKHRYTHEDGLVSWDIDYTASIHIRDEDGETGEDEDTGIITIQLVNERPSANAIVRTPSLPSSYQQWYFYVGKDIDITDKCSDYEGCIDKIEYTIKDGGKIIMHSVDFKTDKVDSNYLESCTATDKDHVLNFKRGGNFTLTVTVTDEMGYSHTFTKVLNVTPVPTAPVAGIKGTTYTYKNFDAKFEDNSTDANDDIVKWVWGDVEYFDAVVDENGDETGEGTWRKAEPGKDYTGSLSNGNRTTAGVKPNVAGTLKFANYGKYRLNITVTDATGLTDSATHIVDVLEDIPVVNPTVPEDKDDDKSVYTVTFINTDGTKTSTTVKAGEKVPAEKVPTIVDKEGLTEHGWTIDGKSLVEPTGVTVNGNITFVVFTTPEDSNKNVCTVTFINTDGSRTEVKVAKGGNVPVSKVPSVIDMPHIAENGWTAGEGIVNPTTVKIDRDMVFWVDTTPENDETHNVIFVNTDGSTTTVKVKDGEKVPNASVPKIIDLKEYKENGWTSDGETIVKPSTIPIKSDMVFWVDKDPIDAIKTHVVTFINTDGTRTEVVVQEGKRVPQDSIPVIKDMPGMTENGWVQDSQTKIVDPAKVIVKKDIVFHVDTTPDPEKETFKVTFTNTDGTVKTIEVPKGEKIPADKVPDIIDLPDITENGWTKDGVTIEDPKEVTVDRDLHFWVDYDKTPTGVSHTVTFVNTDGTTSTVLVPHGQTVNANDVPGIINYPGYIEKGWTTDGQTTQDPTTTPVLKDMVYYVLKTPEATGPDDEKTHLDSEGRLIVKQNRKACISLKESLSPPGDPIDWSRTEWEVISINNYDVNDVKFKGGSASGAEAYFIAKTPGVFKIKITLHNKYSDQLAGTKPNANKLTARTHTITVLVIEDEAPDATLFVNNANPDFHNYPTSIDVTVASSVTSPDYDNIGKYTWKVVRDTNNNGRFDDEKQSIAEMSGDGLTSVTFPVQFQSGVVGQFLASLFVKEEPGQATLPEYITDADKKDATATAQFEVNWTPCISCDFQLNGNQWAYVDDVIHISSIVRDETVSTCNVQWTLKKKVGDNYIDVATGKNDLCDVWSFNTLGGDVRITDDGFYVMEAVITDDHGYTETFVSNEIRVYDLPVAVISDNPQYRWDDTQWQYKQARKFMLDGDASTVDDSTGPALHQIVHDKDEWSITPVSGGAAADAVYVLADDGATRLQSDYDSYFGVGNNAFNEQIAIITPGVYQVSYRVTNSYGKRSPITTQLITIVKDEEPKVNIGNPSSHDYLGSEENNAMVKIGLTNITVVSTDYDIVGGDDNFVAQYRYDSNNDGNYDDETWQPCELETTSNGPKDSIHISMTANVNQVGWYQFKLNLKESFGQETLETIIPDSCYIRSEYFHEVEVDNIRPNATFDVSSKADGDVIFVMGQSDANAEIGEKSKNFSNSFGTVPGADFINMNVETIENVFDCKFALHTTWDTRSDMDTHIYLYDKDGRQLDHIWYRNRTGTGVTLNVDDTSGANSADQNVTEPNVGGGEWFTIDFPNLPSNVAKMTVSIVAYSGSATTTVSLVNTTDRTITLQQTKYVSGTVNFGELKKGNNDIWNFYDPNGKLFSGSKANSLADCLTDVAWRPDSARFVIWSEDEITRDMQNGTEEFLETLALLNQENIHLIVLGSSSNESPAKALISQCLNECTFINTGTVDGDLQAAQDFIVAVMMKRHSNNVKYVLVNEETIYNKHYKDFNGHAHWYAGGEPTDTIASSRWWYSHTPEYFCNQLGLLGSNEMWLTNEITMFPQTGRYYVNFKQKDNSVPNAYLSDNSTENPFNEYRYWSNNYGNDEYDVTGTIANPYAEIYVHRRPIADYEFDAKLSPTSELQGITVANAAYDLDHYEPGNPISREDKGLQMYEWTYQLAGNNASKKTALFRNAADGEAWINAELAKIAYNSQTEVLISYRVRDIDGVEHSERAQWKERITGSIYYAPKNSYHHTKTTEDMVIDGVRIPAGTYITTSYEEAISELRAAADAKQKTYEEKVAAYESAQAIANAKDAAATQKEQEALAAEKLRDDKQAEVDAQQNVVNRSQNTLNAAKNTLQQTNDKISDLEAQIAAKQAEYDAASTTLDNAKKAQQNAEKALSDKQASIKSMQSELTTAKAKRDALVAELDALKATDTSGMTEEEKTQHAAKVTAKQTEVTNANKTVSDLETRITTAEGQLSALETAASDAKSATSAAQSKKDQLAADISNLKSALKNEQAKVAGETSAVNAAQSDYNAQLKKLNQLKSELNTLTNQATAARNAATNARNESNNAANTAVAAKSAMDTAKAAWDAAEAAVAAVKPITNNANVWTENDQTITIPDGVWSLYNTIRVSGSPLAPVAKFKTNKIYYDIKENINITDMSYSPNGNNIVRWDWEIAGGVAKIDQKISYSTTGAAGTTQVTDVADMEKRITQYVTDLVNKQQLGLTNEENSYKITLNVTDDKSVPMQSERSYSVTITIVPSNNPPTIDPNPDTNKDGRDDTGSFYRKDGVMIYEYDSYDANEVNPFYDYNGTAQKKGTEYLDWTLVIKDPDNEDSYGTANDSPTFTLEYLFERFKTKTIKTVTIDESSTDTKEYGPKTITATDGKDNTKVAPFTTSKDEGLNWGTYRITTTVTDNPNNHSASKSAFITTNPDVIPKHLYVIPRIDVTNNHYEWDGTIDTQEQIPVGDTVTITVDSDEETTGMVIRFPDGIGGEVRRDATLTGTTTNDDGSVTKHWSCDMVIPDTIEEDFLENGKGYTYYCEGWTDYGTDGGYANKTRTKVLPCKMNVLAIKLYDFAITDVADPAVKTTDIHDYVYALAFDELNAPALTKLGYSFYFDLYSMGLKNDNDTIRIRPHFYGYNSVTMRYTDELDVYYKNDAGDYVLATTDPNGTRDAGDTMLITSSNTNGHTLGYINELMLGKADKELQGTSQYWTGRYGLPSSAVFVNKGATLAETSLYKGKVLVMFEFVALKNGVPKYNYVTRGQWAAERQEMIDLGNTTAIDKKNTYSRYESQYGSIIILDGSKSAIDNYDARPVWRSSNH